MDEYEKEVVYRYTARACAGILAVVGLLFWIF